MPYVYSVYLLLINLDLITVNSDSYSKCFSSPNNGSGGIGLVDEGLATKLLSLVSKLGIIMKM